MTSRTAKKTRKTGETDISVAINLDGQGKYNIRTGNGMFDHLLAQLSRHGLIDLDMSASGDIEVGWHHIVEDTAIALGNAIEEAVGDGRGITRMGHAFVPLDEALAMVALDFGGRGHSAVDLGLSDSDLGGLPAQLIDHFMDTLAREGKFNLHIQILTGMHNHHKAEAAFKALARAMRTALTIDKRISGKVPSTKGTIT